MPLPNVSTGDPHVSAHNAERAEINDLETEVGTKITKPANPKVGDLLRWNGTGWGLTDIRFFEGTGAPEGVVAAPVGSRYRDTAGTRGAVEWIKVSGADTSNTGWMLLAGDTDWRNVLGMLTLRSTGVGHTALLRRVNDVVDLYLDIATPNNTDAPWTVLVLPAGFRPGFTRYGAIQDNKEGASGSTAVMADGSVNLYGLAAGKRDRYNGTWTTQDAWPAALPGSAA